MESKALFVASQRERRGRSSARLFPPSPPHLFFFFLGARRRVIQTRFVGFVNIFRVALPRLLLRFFFSFPRSLFAAGPLRPKGLSGNWIDISPIQIIISI